MSRNEDNYKPLAFFEKHVSSKSAGIQKFTGDDGEFYFVFNENKKIALISEGYPTEAARDNGAASVKKNIKNKDRYVYATLKNGQHEFRLRAGNNQEIARSPWFGAASSAKTGAAYLMGARKRPVSKPKAAAVKAKSKNVEDDYRPLAFYKKQTKGSPKKGIEKFKGDDGEFYFVYNENGKVALISEGYPTAAARDNGAESVKKNLKNKDRYSYVKMKNGKHEFRLKAGNHQEIARSPWFASAAAATTGAAYLLGTRKRAAVKPKVKTKPKVKAAPIVAAAVATAAVAAAPRDKDDDYLPCREYHGHTVNDKVNNVAFFKHSDGQFYFAMYDDDGDVRLRSEGFRTAAQRDEELSGALRLKDNPKYYKRLEKGDRYMDVLYDETGREVGRSCLRTKAPVVAPAPAPKPVVAPVAAAAVAAPAIAAKGGLGWLKWLLPLLLIAAVLFGLTKCMGKAKVPVVAPVKIAPVVAKPVVPEPVVPEIVPEPVAPEPIAAEPVAAPISTGLNNCGSSNIAIFSTPYGATPRDVDKLGTYPEFGNSHGLTPSQFFDKLSGQYNNSAMDRSYLDYLFRSMGYVNGFSDAKASMISDDTLASGTRGILGFGNFHGYAYSALNTSGADLEAFRIQGANGSVVHFMKTCGNYMYGCN
ncbi:MAG: YegP family protein [Robiginitomaculum sp.]